MSGHTGHGLPPGYVGVLLVLCDGDPEQREKKEEESWLRVMMEYIKHLKIILLNYLSYQQLLFSKA